MYCSINKFILVCLLAIISGCVPASATPTQKTKTTLSSLEIYHFIKAITKNTRGVLVFDDYCSFVDKHTAWLAFHGARNALARKKYTYTNEQFDCEDFSREGVLALKKLYNKRGLKENPLVGWVVYDVDGDQGYHARPFVIDLEGRLLTYEMMTPIELNAGLQELSETELASVHWVII